MSSQPHSYITMEPILGSSVCLICFQMTEKHILVPPDAPGKLFINCNKYLHSTLTTGTLKDIDLHNENQVPLCKRCFDSAWELTQLSEQLTTIQKYISDLSIEFSMAVFHRRSQVYSIGQSCKSSSIVEFNEACLPPNLFSMKLGDQNINTNKNNQEMDINGLILQTDISNVKCEASDNQFDNLSGNPQPAVANDDAEIQFNIENLDKQCEQPTEQNIASVTEMGIVHVADRNDSKKCADPNDGLKLTIPDLLKSVKMPTIILERIKIVDHKFDVSAVNSNQTNCASRQINLDETFMDDEFSIPSCAPKSPEDVKLLKCFYCEKTFAQECQRTHHHKTHTKDKNKCPLDKQKFLYENNKKICEVTHSGKQSSYKKCSYCEKGFSSPICLQNHERTHTGEKPFKCSYCNKRFNQRIHMQCHERTHTGEKPFKCSFCNNGFNQRIHLQLHERIHTGEQPFKCSLCNNRFSQSSSLKRHERTHSGEKHFKCSFCDESFREKYNLKAHERLHTREKPYQCLYCEKPFSVSRDRSYHNQKCHPEQISSLVSQSANQKDVSLGHVKQEEKMHSTGHMEFKCSFCEMTFSHDEERANHEKIHRTEDEIVNQNLIVGI